MTAKDVINMQVTRAKAWCFDNHYTEEQMQSAWEKAVEMKNPVICNLNSHGQSWFLLPVHLLRQLIDMFGGTE